MSKKVLEMEHNITQIRDRIKDVEWQLDQMDPEEQEYLLGERRRAIDKLRHLQVKLLDAKMEEVDET
jgi:hypothetical protein